MLTTYLFMLTSFCNRPVWQCCWGHLFHRLMVVFPTLLSTHPEGSLKAMNILWLELAVHEFPVVFAAHHDQKLPLNGRSMLGHPFCLDTLKDFHLCHLKKTPISLILLCAGKCRFRLPFSLACFFIPNSLCPKILSIPLEGSLNVMNMLWLE